FLPTAAPPPQESPPQLGNDVLARVRAPFQIKSTDASKLFFILRKESSEDIALVLPHLYPDTRKAMLAYFSEDEAAQAIEASARFRVVDPELIVLLKAELERRVSALHGGPEVASRLLDDATPEDRERITAALKRFDPTSASSIKSAAPPDLPPDVFDDIAAPTPEEKRESNKKDDEEPPESGGGSSPFGDGSGSPPAPQLFLDQDPT
ncbi:MAG: hypothetical protein COB53_06460, partial [Elusimicrobia bacterium]